jgi:hypothetical protein
MAATAPVKFRIDVDIHNLLMNSASAPERPEVKSAALPEPVFPQYPELLKDPGRKQLPKSATGRLSKSGGKCAAG